MAEGGTGTIFDAGCIAHLADVFGISRAEAASWTPLPGGRILAGGRLLVKWHWMLTADRAPLFEQVLRATGESGTAPGAVAARDGALAPRFGGRFFSLFHRVPERGQAADHPAEAGRAAGRMHRALAGVEGKAACPRGIDADAAAALLGGHGRPDLAEALVACSRAVAGAPGQLVHRDLHGGNFLSTAHGVLVVDFDSFASGPRIVDALFGAFRLAGGAPGVMAAFLDAWAAEAGMSPEESRAGLDGLAADFLLKTGFILREAAAGNTAFVKDLDNYLGYSERALALCAAFPGGVGQLLEQGKGL